MNNNDPPREASTLWPAYSTRALAELAEAVLCQEYAKDLRNIEMLEAIVEEDAPRFQRAWEDRYKRDWFTGREK